MVGGGGGETQRRVTRKYPHIPGEGILTQSFSRAKSGHWKAGKLLSYGLLKRPDSEVRASGHRCYKKRIVASFITRKAGQGKNSFSMKAFLAS